MRIRLIRDALKRIRAGIYGACLVCRSAIAYERSGGRSRNADLHALRFRVLRAYDSVNGTPSAAKGQHPQMAPGRILVGVNFRQPSLAAASWAAAHFGKSRIELAHVCRIRSTSVPAAGDARARRSSGPGCGQPSAALRGFAGTLRAKELSVQVRVGSPVDSLAEAAATLVRSWSCSAAKRVDGSRGRTLERLIRRLAVPALVVDGRVRESPRRILAAWMTPPSAATSSGWAAALARHFGAELTLLHALSDSLLAHQWLWEEEARESGSASLGTSSRWVAPTSCVATAAKR